MDIHKLRMALIVAESRIKTELEYSTDISRDFILDDLKKIKDANLELDKFEDEKYSIKVSK